MISSKHLRNYIIKPALTYLDMWSSVSEELLIFTAANESLGGTYLRQVSGPALGIYQMEPPTYLNVWKEHLPEFPIQKKKIFAIYGEDKGIPPAEYMVRDLFFATVMARHLYASFTEPLPSLDKVAIANYYKKYWNTSAGKADIYQAIRNYETFIAT